MLATIVVKLTSKLKARDLSYISDLMRKEDAEELIVALNEMCFHLSDDSKDSVMTYYWLSGSFNWTLCVGAVKPTVIARLGVESIDKKYQRDQYG